MVSGKWIFILLPGNKRRNCRPRNSLQLCANAAWHKRADPVGWPLLSFVV